MSNNYDTVKKWYDKGNWNIARCRDAVVKGWITAEEFEEITGDVYSEK